MNKQQPIKDRARRYKQALLSGEPLRPSDDARSLGDLAALCEATNEAMRIVAERTAPPESPLRVLLTDD